MPGAGRRPQSSAQGLRCAPEGLRAADFMVTKKAKVLDLILAFEIWPIMAKTFNPRQRNPYGHSMLTLRNVDKGAETSRIYQLARRTYDGTVSWGFGDPPEGDSDALPDDLNEAAVRTTTQSFHGPSRISQHGPVLLSQAERKIWPHPQPSYTSSPSKPPILGFFGSSASKTSAASTPSKTFKAPAAPAPSKRTVASTSTTAAPSSEISQPARKKRQSPSVHLPKVPLFTLPRAALLAPLHPVILPYPP
ncbi:hypothetical protein CF327_g7384 [Tilletia walkeri]|nr:hypothetical protein CF327_g7384 [Tilletia walkeri]